ncbi:hypothetical protein [Salinigranum marinum]|uniref:hypothetical protein n=1 Tax=Salinigranum marinum TaxID=1515595 RepID=UPI002989A01A|nr:hypothetical protein [Salinigranum marinum]
MSQYSELNVYFHRLAPGSPTDETLFKFYDEGYILCHYDDVASFSADEYENGAADLEDIVDFAESGGICLIQLDADNDYYDRGRKLGVVTPETEPFIIGVDEDGTRTEEFTDPKEAKNHLEGHEEVTKIYKGVELQTEIRELTSHEYLLSAYEPPSTTFCRWRVVEDQIKALLSGEQLPIDESTSYSPDQTERLCEEYLREEYQYYPLIQPGGSSGINQSFDLIGGIGDDSVFGEVKNTKGTSQSALDDLEDEANGQTRTFYFSRNPVKETREGVEIVLLEEVLEGLSGIDRTHRMMERMTTW